MKPIPRKELLAFARECLKLEQLLSEDDLNELGKFIKLVRSMEESGGLSALKALLRPEEGTDSAGFGAACDSAVCSAPNGAVEAPSKTLRIDHS